VNKGKTGNTMTQ